MDLMEKLEHEKKMEKYMTKKRIYNNSNRVVTYDADPEKVEREERKEAMRKQAEEDKRKIEQQQRRKDELSQLKEKRDKAIKNTVDAVKNVPKNIKKAIVGEDVEIYKQLLDESLTDLFMIMESENQSQGYKSGASEMAPAGTRWVYVLTIDAKLATSKIIRWWTKTPYAHSALSFDKSLTNMVSFSIGGGHNGFVRENLKTLYKPDAVFSLYKIAVPDDALIIMKDAIRNIEMLKDTNKGYRYSIKGLIGFIDTKHSGMYNTNERKMFCSQFVAKMFATAGMKIFNKEDYDVKPYDFATNKNFKFCYRGTVKNFDPSKIR